LGDTLYLGSRSSDFFIRVYDKDLESEGQIKGTRLEMVLKDDKANEFVRNYLDAKESETFNNLSFLSSKVLNNYLRFISKSASRNERCDTAKWWLEFTGTLEKLSLGKGKGKMTLEKVCKWLEHQVCSSMKLIVETKGKEYLNGMIEKAILSPQQVEMKDSYRKVINFN
jgi:phage replication initiation protein